MFLAFLSAENIQPLLGEVSEDAMEKLLAAWKEQEDKLKKLLEKTKTKKPADAPKKNKSGYLFFCQEMRPVVKEENPTMKANEIMAELGARWKELKENEPEEVERYMCMAAEDKTRYEEEMKNYVPSADEEEKPKEKKSRAKKPADSPKKNKSGYLFFCQEMRPVVKKENPEMKTNEIMAELGARWKELKENEPEEVERYMNMAAEDKTRYEEEMKNYVPSADEEENPKEKKPRAKKSKEEKPKETPIPTPTPSPATSPAKKSTKSAKSTKEVPKKTAEELYIESVQAVIREVVDASPDGAVTVKQVKAALKEKGIDAPKNLKEMIVNM
jgi:KaiC/GvpD/RAD55 family RecA-like ATPase